MIHLRPDSVAYARSTAVSANPDVGGYVTPDNTVLEGQNPSALVKAMQAPVASATDSFKATLSESIAAKALRGFEYSSMPSEAGFEPSKALGESVSMYTADELEFLADARSSAELARRRSQVQDTRDNYSAMGQNLTSTIAASMLDVDMVLGTGLGALTKVSRAARLAIGLSANTVALDAASHGGHLTPLDIIATSVGVAMGAIPGVRKAARAVEQETANAERAAANTAEATATPAAQAEVRASTVPDPDYPNLDPDFYSGKPHVEVRTGAGGRINTDTANLVRTVLNVGDDLPEGVRLLGTRLLSSLDADEAIPAVVRGGSSVEARSAVHINNVSGDMRAEIRATGPVQYTLTDQIRAMTPEEKTIVLHEAVHAKTARTLRAVRDGKVTEGPQYDAAKRIAEIRQFVNSRTVAGNLPTDKRGAYLVRYGLGSDDEFLAQLFNSPDFRAHLRQFDMPGTKGTVFSEVIRKVVQMLTGEAPNGNALDATLKAFDDLLEVPMTDKATFQRIPSPMPELQSKVLQAPNLLDMNNKVMGFLNRNFSLYERLKSFGSKAAILADQLVVDATGTEARSAAHYARAHYLSSNVAIVQVDDAIKQALSPTWPLLQRMRHPVLYREAQAEMSQKVHAQLAENHERFLKGQVVNTSTDPRVNNVVDTFVKSGWAKEELRRIKAAGIAGSDSVAESPYYLPRQHSGTKLNNYLRENVDVTSADIVGMYKQQFKTMFASNGITDATAQKLGRQMFDNMQDQAARVHGYRQSIAGMSFDDIENTLSSLGATDPTVQGFLDAVRNAGTGANKVRNLRHRVEFDMTAQYTTQSGKLISPSQFVNNDVMGLMEGYSRRMAGRVGLAEAGFPDLRDVVRAVDEAAAEAPVPSEALRTLDDTVNQLMGFRTGEDVPDILRSASIIGGALNLANSGIYQLADMSLMLQQFGIKKTLRAFASTSFGRDAMQLAKSADYGARLQDVIEARHVLSGKYRSILTHLEDNKDIGSLGIAHRYVQQLGQGTRFVNGMEFIRRGQSKLVAGLIADTVDDAIRGNASAITALERFGMNSQILDDLRKATAANADLRKWPDSVRTQIESITHNMADSIVLENRLGELPAWMQFSAVGKVVLPYMTFVAGAWNKILRRTAKLDGTTGVAMALAYQMPLVTLSSTTSLFLGGKDVTPEAVAKRALVQVPIMSWAGFAVDFATNGASNNLAALSLVDRMHAAMSSIANGETNPESLIKAVPFLSILPGMRLMGASLADDE